MEAFGIDRQRLPYSHMVCADESILIVTRSITLSNDWPMLKRRECHRATPNKHTMHGGWLQPEMCPQFTIVLVENKAAGTRAIVVVHCTHRGNAPQLVKPPLATAASCDGRVHLFVCLFVCLSVCLSVAKLQKNAIFSKLSNIELWSLLTTYKKSYLCFSKNPLLDP